MSAIYRYPGIAPFSKKEKDVFFGREKEIEILYSSIMSNQCTLMIGKSGIGKSSLIEAGLLPRMEKENSDNPHDKRIFMPLSIRVGSWIKQQEITLLDKLKESAFEKTNSSELPEFMSFMDEKLKNSLWYKLKCFQFQSHLQNKKKIFLLIFDQLEELFTFPFDQFKELQREINEISSSNLPDTIRNIVEETERKDGNLISDVESEVLYSSIPVKFLFSIRSDKLSLVIRLKEAVGNILQNPYELLPLSMEQAKRAIREPALRLGDFLTTPFTINDQAVEVICKFLLSQSCEVVDSIFIEPGIEPVTLQIICQHIERNISPADTDRNINEIEIGDPNEIIKNFYRDTLNQLQLDDTNLVKVRQMIEEDMIYEPDLRRLILYKEIIVKDRGLTEELLQKLVRSGLLREINSIGPKSSYEISHDWLVLPILDAKKERLGISSSERFDATIAALEKEARKNPNDYSTFKKMGDYYYFLEDYIKAIEKYSQAIEKKNQLGIKGGDLELYFSRGDSYYKMRNHEQSNKDLEEVLKIEPNHLLANFYTAYNYHMSEKFDQAAKFYKKVIDIDPGYTTAYYNLGLLERINKEFKESEKYFLKTIELDPKDFEAYYSLALVAHDSKDFKKAINYIEKCLLLNPAYINAYFQKAITYEAMSQPEESLKCYNKILEIDPYNQIAYKNLGYIFKTLQNFPEAEKNFQKALQLNRDDHEPYYDLGVLANDQNKYRDAIPFFDKCLTLKPDYINALIEKAYAFSNLREVDEANECYEKVLEIDPGNKIALEGINVLKENINRLVNSIRDNPQDYESMYALGVIANNERNFGKAINYFDNVLSLKPDHVNALIEKAYAYNSINQNDNSIICYNKILEIDPTNNLAYRSLGIIYDSQGKLDLAEKNFLKAIEANPDDYTSNYRLGLIANDLQRYEEAITYFEKVIQMKPDHIDALVEQAFAFSNLKKINNAFECYQKILQIDPGNSKAYRNLGILYDIQDNPAEAEKYFLKAIEMDPRDYNSYYELGILSNRLKNYTKAIECFERAIAIKPDFIKAYNYMGYYYMQAKDYEKAISHYLKVIQTEPGTINAYYNLGLAFKKINDLPKALTYFQNAVEVNKTDHEAYYQLGEIYLQIGNTQEAINNYKKALKIKPDFREALDKLNALSKTPVGATNSSSL
jgi:tetratricopeptide (TPR) repeat protein